MSPVSASYYHVIGMQRGHPIRQLSSISLEPAELALFDARAAIRFLDQSTGRDLRLMNVEPDDTFLQCNQFHNASHRFTLTNLRRWVRELNVPGGKKSPTAR